MVWAVKYDSPQCGHDHMGMPSTTSNDLPLPKLRVTRRRCTPKRPHEAHTPLDEVERDDVENARVADFDDRFGLAAIERPASDDDFGLVSLTVFLALDDAAREDDVFEIEDCKVFIFKFSNGVNGYDIAQ
jgi:hypothetical protein